MSSGRDGSRRRSTPPAAPCSASRSAPARSARPRPSGSPPSTASGSTAAAGPRPRTSRTGAEGLGAQGEAVAFAAVEERGETATVYNLEVEGTHTYFVGNAQALVHNDCIEDAETGELYDKKRREAIEKLAMYGPYNERSFGIFANAVFGEQHAKDAYEKVQWGRHQAKQLTFDGYWYLRKTNERENYFPNAWNALRQALYEGEPRATAAVKALIAAAKREGVEADWGGERMREAERLIARNTPPAPTGKPGDRFIVPEMSKELRDSLNIDMLLGIGDYWAELSDGQRALVNQALGELKDKDKQAKLLKELAGDPISKRVVDQPPGPATRGSTACRRRSLPACPS